MKRIIYTIFGLLIIWFFIKNSNFLYANTDIADSDIANTDIADSNIADSDIADSDIANSDICCVWELNITLSAYLSTSKVPSCPSLLTIVKNLLLFLYISQEFQFEN